MVTPHPTNIPPESTAIEPKFMRIIIFEFLIKLKLNY